MRILLIEDSVRLADTLTESLEKEQFVVDAVNDGGRGYEYASSGIYDLVVLDLMLPVMDGYEVLRRLRQEGNEVPVLILSAKSELEDKVEGFRRGADDYLTKPFEIQELVMRIQAIVRRRGGREIVYLQAGNLRLDTGNCLLENMDTGKSMEIGGKELQLLELFLSNQGLVLEKELIATKIWGYESNAEYNNVEVYVSFLRRKLNYLQANIRLRAVRGVGYTMEVCDA
ncbi:MAG: response regulator transcription factor [Muribaculaceae bacterium]|nr:response regulator transcription factor [Roseburia sp.]MCM1431332.1 response regulator transcription factor [Muribaculaceae bacterium]MCM1491774.1 response regulator transcription factor [Muribaculaceae bacterium]